VSTFVDTSFCFATLATCDVVPLQQITPQLADFGGVDV